MWIRRILFSPLKVAHPPFGVGVCSAAACCSDLTEKGAAISRCHCNSLPLTCTHAIRHKKFSLRVLGARLGECALRLAGCLVKLCIFLRCVCLFAYISCKLTVVLKPSPMSHVPQINCKCIFFPCIVCLSCSLCLCCSAGFKWHFSIQFSSAEDTHVFTSA